MLNQAETLWSQTEDLISSKDDSTKYTIYNSNSYKEAYAAMIYLRDHVKPIIQKVSNGNAVSLTEYNLVAKESKAQEIINTEKDTTATSYAETKKIKSTETISGTPTVSTVDTVGTAEASTSTGEWATVNAGGGQETKEEVGNIVEVGPRMRGKINSSTSGNKLEAFQAVWLGQRGHQHLRPSPQGVLPLH